MPAQENGSPRWFYPRRRLGRRVRSKFPEEPDDFATSVVDCQRHQALARLDRSGIGCQEPGPGSHRRHVESDHYRQPDRNRPIRSGHGATHRAKAQRSGYRLAHDRQTGQRRTGCVPTRVGSNARQRRVRELRVGSAAGRAGVGPAARRARGALHRIGQEVVEGARQPDDEGSGDTCGDRSDRTALRCRGDDQRDADLHTAPVSSGAQRHVAGR